MFNSQKHILHDLWRKQLIFFYLGIFVGFCCFLNMYHSSRILNVSRTCVTLWFWYVIITLKDISQDLYILSSYKHIYLSQKDCSYTDFKTEFKKRNVQYSVSVVATTSCFLLLGFLCFLLKEELNDNVSFSYWYCWYLCWDFLLYSSINVGNGGKTTSCLTLVVKVSQWTCAFLIESSSKLGWKWPLQAICFNLLFKAPLPSKFSRGLFN